MAKPAPKNQKPTPAAPPPEPEKVELIAATPIRIDGIDVAIGEAFLALPEHAAPLLERGDATAVPTE